MNLPAIVLTKKVYLFAAIALCLAAASALAFFGYMAQGIAAGALIGLPGREQDVAQYQHQAMPWFVASLLFQVGLVGCLVLLFRLVPDEKPIAGVGVRLFWAVVFGPLLTLLIADVMTSVGHWIAR